MLTENTNTADLIRQAEQRPMAQRILTISLLTSGFFILFGTIVAVAAF